MTTAAAAIAGVRAAQMNRARYEQQQRDMAALRQRERQRDLYDARRVAEWHMLPPAPVDPAKEREKREAQRRYALLVSFPTHTHQQIDGVEQDECAICLNAFAAGEKLKTLPCAGAHVFHSGCMRRWLEQGNSCPTCRQDLTSAASSSKASSSSPTAGDPDAYVDAYRRRLLVPDADIQYAASC